MRRFSVLGLVCGLLTVPTVLVAFGHEASAPAPARDVEWQTSRVGTGIAYRDEAGATQVAVREPELFGTGWCVDDPDRSRAFVGTVPREGHPVEEVARRWAEAASLDVVTGDRLGHGWVRADPRRADLEVSIPPGPCNPQRARLTVRRVDDRAVILLRDIDVPGALSEADAESKLDQILRSLT